MLITPSAVAYDEIAPEMMARMPLVSDDDGYEGPKKPSSEWRFHRDILKARPDVNAVVHTHAPFCTILSIAPQADSGDSLYDGRFWWTRMCGLRIMRGTARRPYRGMSSALWRGAMAV